MPVTLSRLPLNALRTFEVAARRLSFKNAAEELCVSPTTVSNQIRQLERDLQCQLFIRRTRRVALTDAGRSLYGVLNRAFEDIRREIEAHVAAPRKTVSLAVGPIFGTRWLAPRLAEFHERRPDIDLILHHSPRITDESAFDCSIAVDWGVGEWRGLEATFLMGIEYAPVVSPALMEARGGLSDVADLTRYPIIHQHDRSEWRAWLDHAGHPDLALRDETIIVDSNLVVEAAAQGVGVALGVFPFAKRDVVEGRLIRPFEIALKPTRSFHLLTRPGARQTREIAAVCGWLEEEASKEG